MQPRRLGARRRTWHGALPLACVVASDRTQNRGGESSGGRRTPGEHRRAAPAWPGVGVVAERTPGGSKASKRACRPFTGEPSVGGEGTVRAAHLRVGRGDRTNDREDRRPGSCVPRPPSGGCERQRAGAKRRKRPRRTRKHCAGGSRRTNPQGSRWPARAGTAPREGKALKGDSRDASGMKEGREAQGATANDEIQKVSSEPRAGRNRREGQEP